MGCQIIQQPNGKFALFSSVVDAFVMLDADGQDIVDYFVERETQTITENVKRKIAALQAGEKAYYQFTMTWDEALKMHRKHSDPEPEIDKLIQQIESVKR